MTTSSTGADTSTNHNVVDVYGISIEGLTGNIVADVAALFDTKYNVANINGANDIDHKTYGTAIITDSNFDSRNHVTTIDSNKNNNTNKNKRCSKEELKLYKLVNENNYWQPRDASIKGAQLIERHWRRSKSSNSGSSNNSNNTNDAYGFTVMQFNMLADGLSTGYIDSSDTTQKCKNIDDKTWFNKCEKCFLRVNPLCLQWRYRGLRLIEEILRFECDLIAIEECDQSEWMYESYLKDHGYEMVFIEKCDSPCARIGDMFINSKNKKEFQVEQEKFNNTLKLTPQQKKNFHLKNDGCLILYKDELFELLSTPSTNNSNNNNNNNNNEIKHFKTAAEIYDWQSYCLGEIKDSRYKKTCNKVGAVDKSPYRSVAQTVSLFEKKKIPNNQPRQEFVRQEFVSMKCSVICDLIDLDKKIYDKSTGIFLGYDKLNLIDVKKSKKAGKDVFKKTSLTFIALHMKHRATNEEFVFVTTHLKSTKDSDGEKMRVGQMEAMFGYGPYREINVKDGIVNEPQPIIHNPNNLPIILCCDLNAKPYDTMKFDKSLNKMVKDYGHECYSITTGRTNNDSDEKDNHNGGLSLGFESLYYVALGNKEPKYTTWKERRNEENVDSKSGDVSKHTIDYIFTKDVESKLGFTHFLEIPDIDENTQEKLGKALLPDWHYPSDHFSLAMRLQWKSRTLAPSTTSAPTVASNRARTAAGKTSPISPKNANSLGDEPMGMVELKDDHDNCIDNIDFEKKTTDVKQSDIGDGDEETHKYTISNALVLIICARKYDDDEMDNLESVKLDMKKMKDLWQEQFNYEVITNDITPNENEYYIDESAVYAKIEVARRLLSNNENQFDGFILIYSGYGHRNGIITSANEDVKLEDIEKKFSAKYLKEFKDCPKIFIIDACERYRDPTTMSTRVKEIKEGKNATKVQHYHPMANTIRVFGNTIRYGVSGGSKTGSLITQLHLTFERYILTKRNVFKEKTFQQLLNPIKKELHKEQYGNQVLQIQDTLLGIDVYITPNDKKQ